MNITWRWYEPDHNPYRTYHREGNTTFPAKNARQNPNQQSEYKKGKTGKLQCQENTV